MAQINKPNEYFNTITWTADGTSPRSFTGVGFQPDLVWGKRRSVAADHNLYDVVRGAGSDKALMSNSDNVEGDSSASFGYLSSLDSDGFTATTGSTNNNYWNNGTDTYVAWNWLAGGTASSNTDGSITSSVSVNTTSGFSIVGWTGTGVNATIGHNLGETPAVVIAKDRTAINDWYVYHHKNTSEPETDYLRLNLTAATTDNSLLWNDTAPTSSVFSIGTSSGINVSGRNYIAYCFAEKKGFSKFGSYVGNGNADGTFVYTGFKPAFIVVKGSTIAENWNIRDNKRSTINPANKNLVANDSRAEESFYATDLLSNGFKIRTSEGGHNSSGNTYIYMAFAENPLVGTNDVPATAR